MTSSHSATERRGRNDQQVVSKQTPRALKRRGEFKEGQRRDESVYKTDPAKTATRVIIPASMGGFKPRAPPEGLLVAEGLGIDPVEDPGEVEELAPVALFYGDGMIEC